ncbi:MAG: sigma 54-interacting transcriptional regulator, partial [Phycisphaeraceae bacterium]|nr:sigma 54-interacting transcriptional regulator [Phycisphaeraceae bacterium]
MELFKAEDRRLAENIAALNNCNPFLPEWIELEQRILGGRRRSPRVWSVQFDQSRKHSNVQRLLDRVEPLVEKIRERLDHDGTEIDAASLRRYVDLVVFVLYQRYQPALHRLSLEAESPSGPPAAVPWWAGFRDEADRLLAVPRRRLADVPETAHLLACFFQIRRAFVNIFDHIVGESMIAARLRASIWQSIFTHDLVRYLGGRYRHMGDLTTLITGPSGTGKELVARAIGYSRYVPFDSNTGRFNAQYKRSFFPLNLSALSPTLIESELFGQARGAFTGAVADRIGWLELCPVLGTVF